MLFSYWYMFFACIGIATLAMSAGIGGATFFIPFILLVLHVPVKSAIAIGIFVEIFGFTAGVYNYWRLGKIDFSLAKKTLLFAVIFTVIGVTLNQVIRPSVVEYVFILALMIFATQLLLNRPSKKEIARRFDGISAAVSSFGGLLLGFISSGLGEANEYNYFVRLKKSPAVTAGTSVLVVAVCAITATLAQSYFIMRGSGFGTIAPYTMLIIYSVLGSLVGAKLGSILSSHVERESFRKFISVLLYLVAVVSLVKVLLVT